MSIKENNMEHRVSMAQNMTAYTYTYDSNYEAASVMHMKNTTHSHSSYIVSIGSWYIPFAQLKYLIMSYHEIHENSKFYILLTFLTVSPSTSAQGVVGSVSV